MIGLALAQGMVALLRRAAEPQPPGPDPALLQKKLDYADIAFTEQARELDQARRQQAQTQQALEEAHREIEGLRVAAERGCEGCRRQMLQAQLDTANIREVLSNVADDRAELARLREEDRKCWLAAEAEVEQRDATISAMCNEMTEVKERHREVLVTHEAELAAALQLPARRSWPDLLAAVTRQGEDLRNAQQAESLLKLRLRRLEQRPAQAEGVAPFFEVYKGMGQEQTISTGERAADAPHRASFACLWDEINGDRALWKSNPWVWVVEFKRAEPTPGQTEGGR